MKVGTLFLFEHIFMS